MRCPAPGPDAPRGPTATPSPSTYTCGATGCAAPTPATDLPLPRLPPWRAGSSVEHSRGPWVGEVGARYHAEADRLAPEATATEAFWEVFAAASVRFSAGKVDWTVHLRGTNLLDEDQRLHTSLRKDEVPLPGRGVMLSLSADW